MWPRAVLLTSQKEREKEMNCPGRRCFMGCFVLLLGLGGRERNELTLFTDSQAPSYGGRVAHGPSWTEAEDLVFLNTDVVMINRSSHQRCTRFYIWIGCTKSYSGWSLDNLHDVMPSRRSHFSQSNGHELKSLCTFCLYKGCARLDDLRGTLLIPPYLGSVLYRVYPARAGRVHPGIFRIAQLLVINFNETYAGLIDSLHDLHPWQQTCTAQARTVYRVQKEYSWVQVHALLAYITWPKVDGNWKKGENRRRIFRDILPYIYMYMYMHSTVHTRILRICTLEDGETGQGTTRYGVEETEFLLAVIVRSVRSTS